MDTNVKITKKMRFETLQDLIGLAEEAEFEGFDFKGLNEFCANEIAQLEKKAVKARERAAKAREGEDVLLEAVASVLSAEPMTKDEIVEAVQEANPEMEIATPGRIVTRLTTLFKEGKVVKESVTVGETGARRKVMTYALTDAAE